MANMKLVNVDQYDRLSDIKAFEETKSGVKGLVDAGVLKVPRMFINENDKPPTHCCNTDELSSTIPVIDLSGVNDPATRAEIVKKVKEAIKEWGVFQMINHELPISIMNEMIEGSRRFHEQDTEVKKKYYTRDPTKKFQYNSNLNLYTETAAAWKDNLLGSMLPNPPHAHELPDICRDIMFEFTEHVTKVGNTVYELFSEALGLNPNHLKEIGCVDWITIVGNYYPPCPEPELTFGIRSHVDYGLITILLQDKTGGLQFLCKDQWIDIPVVSGGLIVNVGDFIQLITNDKFKSARHRSLVKKESARTSVATFMTPGPTDQNITVYGPIKKLITEDEPAIYKETTFKDFMNHFYTPTVDGRRAKLSDFKL